MSSKPRTQIWFGLLGLWVLIELLYSSRWLDLTATDQSTSPSRPPDPAKTLRAHLTRISSKQPARVWFAPYTPYPEPGEVESRFRRGMYDTLLAMPPTGVISNYGAPKLGAADILFTEASSRGIREEAELAVRLHYGLFAVDLGAVRDTDGIYHLCRSTPGCLTSSDAYALFPLAKGNRQWMQELDQTQRLMGNLPQRAPSPRWRGIVMQPNQWWIPIGLPDSEISRSKPLHVWAQPLWSSAVYRYRASDLPAVVAAELRPDQAKLWLQMAPGLTGLDLCLSQQQSSHWQDNNSECQQIQLRLDHPRVRVDRLIDLGKITQIVTKVVYGPQGRPIPLRLLPSLPQAGNEQSAFSLVIQ